MASRITDDLHVEGTLTCTSLGIPSATVVDDDVAASADIAATKLEHQYIQVYAQESGTDATDESRVVHVVHGSAGSIVKFEAGSVVAATGDSTCTVDLKKNGNSVLSSVITLDNGNSAYTPEEGTVSSSSLSSGDVLEVVFDATAGTGSLPQGVFAVVVLREDAA